MITIDQEYRKIVLNCNHSTFTRAQIVDWAENTLLPALEQIWQNKLSADFTNLRIRSNADIYITEDRRWGIYPKVVVSGDTSLSRRATHDKFDEMSLEMKSEIQNKMTAEGGFTNENWKRSWSKGHIDE